MSEEQIKIWQQIEAKGTEKIRKIKEAMKSGDKEGVRKAHEEYCEFIGKLAKTTGLTTGELDRHFTTSYTGKNTTDYMWKENTSGAMTVVGIEKCTSDKCEQGGKRCPMYADCRQKHELRGIL